MAGLEEPEDQRDPVFVGLGLAPDAIDADERPAPGERIHDVGLPAGQGIHVADRDSLRVDADRLIDVELS